MRVGTVVGRDYYFRGCGSQMGALIWHYTIRVWNTMPSYAMVADNRVMRCINRLELKRLYQWILGLEIIYTGGNLKTV